MPHTPSLPPTAKPTVKRHAWRAGDTLTPGALIKRRRHEVFIAAEDLRMVADGLHDLADLYEEAERAGGLGSGAQKVDDWQ